MYELQGNYILRSWRKPPGWRSDGGRGYEQGKAKAALGCGKIGISMKALNMLQAESLEQHSQLDIGVPRLPAPNKHHLLHIFSNGRIPYGMGARTRTQASML